MWSTLAIIFIFHTICNDEYSTVLCSYNISHGVVVRSHTPQCKWCLLTVERRSGIAHAMRLTMLSNNTTLGIFKFKLVHVYSAVLHGRNVITDGEGEEKERRRGKTLSYCCPQGNRNMTCFREKVRLPSYLHEQHVVFQKPCKAFFPSWHVYQHLLSWCLPYLWQRQRSISFEWWKVHLMSPTYYANNTLV